MSMLVSTPTPPPSYVRTDTRVAEPFERRKLEADLRKIVEHDLLHIVKDVQIVRDTILSSQSTESGRERTQREYEESMNNIRTLAQEEFARLLRQEMSERKRALDYNSLDVPRQQQWFLDNICEGDDQRTSLISTSASKNVEGVLFTSPQQLADGERDTAERFEGGYGSAVADGEPDGPKGKAAAGEGRAEGVEGDNNPRHSPSSIQTQCPHPKSPLSRKESFSSPPPPSTSKLAGDNDDEDGDDTRAYPAQGNASRPYSPRQTPSPGPQPAPGSCPPTPEPSGISLAFVRANGQVYSTRSVMFPNAVVLTVLTSPSSGTGLHRAGSLNLNQHCGSTVAHSDTELPPVQNHDPIASNFTLCERGNSAPSNPHNGSCPSTWPTMLLRTITYDTYVFPDDTRQGIAIPRIHTNPEEDPRRISWGSLRSRPSFDDRCVYQFLTNKGDQTLPPVLSATPDSIHSQLDDQQGMHSLHSRRSVRSLQSSEPEHIVEAKRLEVDARHAEASAKMHEAAAQKKEAEAKRKEAEAKKREAEAQRKLEAARQRELEARRKEEEAIENEKQASEREEEARRKEVDARRREDAARRRLDDALQQEMLARQIEEDARIFEEKVRKEEEEDARRKEEERIDPRPTQETASHQPPGSSRQGRNKAKAEDPARLEASKADVANRSANVVEIAAPRQEKRPKAQGQAQAKRQRHEELEDLRRKELERQRLEEERSLEEKRRKEMLQRQREEQIRLDEELSRREQARIDREAISGILGQERLRDAGQEKEAIRIQGDRRRVAEERGRVAEQSHQRDSPRWQHQRHPDEILRQRARGQPQKEFERKGTVHYQRTTERDRPGAPFDLRVPHPSAGPTTADGGNPKGVYSTPSPSVGSTALNHPSHTGLSNTANSSHMASATPKLPPASTGPAPGAWRIPYSTASKREQERVEGERRAKIAKTVPEKKLTDYTKSGGNNPTTATPWLDYLRQPFVRAKGGGDASRTGADRRAHAVHPRRP